MKVYGASMSPFVRKVLMVAVEKGLSPELVPVVFGKPDPAFRACSPFGKMPGFEDGDFRISDSTAIVTYLDAKYPTPPMLPSSPEDRARAVWYEEFADTILTAAGAKVFFNRVVARLIGREGDLDAADKALAEELPPIYDYLEGVVPEPGGFLVGGQLSIADIGVVSPFVNMMHCGGSPDPARWPRLHAWTQGWFEHAKLKPLIAGEKAFLAARA
ncbi:glutathione S-transferase family protein [Sphingomonas sp. ID1715]|uniref:glutathione S-transferase family protein n=1 Tax=Sphingomonas sp. ID1715 TaxID=1656898 RepID=UPI001488876D|nr:glutathione S-transferase family protein [Sphingomonas sp. ID1715]NNM76664.1 glutathione S-transferase family protein [Sphingomonas sp. ID1715]